MNFQTNGLVKEFKPLCSVIFRRFIDNMLEYGYLIYKSKIMVYEESPFCLLLVSVDAHGGPAILPHQPRQLVTLPLGLCEHQNLGRLVTSDFFQQAGQLLLFLILLAHIHNLKG